MLRRFIQNATSEFPPFPIEQYSGKVMKETVYSDGISSTRKAPLKMLTCNSRKIKVSNWKAIVSEMLHFILFFYWCYFWNNEFFLLQKLYFRHFALARQQRSKQLPTLLFFFYYYFLPNKLGTYSKDMSKHATKVCFQLPKDTATKSASFKVSFSFIFFLPILATGKVALLSYESFFLQNLSLGSTS